MRRLLQTFLCQANLKPCALEEMAAKILVETSVVLQCQHMTFPEPRRGHQNPCCFSRSEDEFGGWPGCPCVASTAGLVCNGVAPQSNWIPQNILKTPGKNLHVVGGNRESPFVALRLACGQLEGRCVPGGLCIRAAGSGSCVLCANGPTVRCCLAGATNRGPHLNCFLPHCMASKKAKGRELPATGWANMIKTPATSSFSGHAIHT